MTKKLSRKGLATKCQIKDSAKKLFKLNGYNKTSIKDICEQGNVKLGSFTYYFKTKDDLVREIYGDVWQKCYDLMDSKIQRPITEIEKNTIFSFLYFYAILHDELTRAFHYEILSMASVSNFIYEYAFPLFECYNQELNLNFTPKEVYDAYMGINGVSREIVTHYLENPNERTLTDLVKILCIFRARIFTMDENLMKVFLYNGLEFEQTYDHSHITLLG